MPERKAKHARPQLVLASGDLIDTVDYRPDGSVMLVLRAPDGGLRAELMAPDDPLEVVGYRK